LRGEHPHGSQLRLAKTGSRNREIGFWPNLFKLRLRYGDFLCIFVLLAQTLCESKQRPAVFGQTREILAIDLLWFGKTNLDRQ